MKPPHHSFFGWSALFASAVFAVLFLIMPAPASAAVTQRSVYYTYDLMGRQLMAKFDSVGGSDGITNTYNGFGDLTATTSSTSGTARTLTYAYDGAGRRTQVTYADGQAFTYTYDNLSRLSGVYQGIGTGTPLDTFSYGTNGLVASRSEMGGSNVAYGWDDGGRLTSQTDAFTGGTGNVGWTFGFNSASQIASETRTNDAYAWTGAVGVNRPYAVNGLNQYTSAGPASFTYDANGNLTGDGTWTYAYDVENRLVSATSGGVTTHLSYDPLGRLSQISGSAVSDRTFLYDGDALVAEYSSGGGMPSRYVHGSNAAADDPLAWYDFASGVLRLLHADHLGSIVAATNNGGSPLINTYDEYGIPGSANSGRFGYTGQTWLYEIGLDYYKARIYSPTLGRFLQTDRVGYKDNVNLYAYVANDPVNAVDPKGTDALWVTNPDGSTTLIIPVQFSGAGATQANVAAIVARDNSLQVSDANLHIQVVSTRTPINGVLNKMDYGPGYNTKMCHSAGECVNRLGGDTAHINSDNGQGIDAAAHDVLHFAGIKDQYVEGQRDAEGNRTSSPSPGYSNSNIMSSRSGNELKPQQFQEARTNQTTKQCSVEIGSRIPVCH